MDDTELIVDDLSGEDLEDTYDGEYSGDGAGSAEDPDTADETDSDPRIADLFRAAEKMGPEYAAHARQIQRAMQRGYTPKLMEASDLRRKFESLADAPPETVAWLGSLYARVMSDPSGAAEMLAQESSRLRGTPPQTQDFDIDDEYATDNERLMFRQVREMESALQELQRFKQTQEQQALSQRVQSGFAELEKTYGPIPPGERVRVLQQMDADGARPESLAIYWLGMNSDKVAAHARAKGVKTGVIKAGLGTGPSRLTGREDDAPPAPKNLREVLTRAARG